MALKSGIYHWFNPGAYGAPAGNQYGDVSRNSLRGPYFMRGDITFAKNFPITERQAFKYRLEIFNVFSLWHSSPPNTNSTLSNTGQFGSLVPIDQSGGVPLPESEQSGMRNLWKPRTIQMTLMYSF